MSVGWAYPLVVGASALGLACNAPVHIVAAWIGAGRHFAGALLAGFAAGLAAAALLTGIGLAHMDCTAADAVALAALNVATYLALSFGYFNLVNICRCSLRLRILLELRAAPAGLSPAALLHRYNAEELLARRLERLTARGRIVATGGRFYQPALGLRLLALAVTTLKVVVLGHGNRTLQKALAHSDSLTQAP
jgi:hypothetical protein